MIEPQKTFDNTYKCLYNMHIQKEISMKLFVVVDPEQGEAVFISPIFKAFKAFIGELRKELTENGVEDADGCSDHDVLEMYGEWVVHTYDTVDIENWPYIPAMEGWND